MTTSLHYAQRLERSYGTKFSLLSSVFNCGVTSDGSPDKPVNNRQVIPIKIGAKGKAVVQSIESFVQCREVFGRGQRPRRLDQCFSL